MNFISHFYCHGGLSNEFNFGLLFPDFLGIVDRRYKLNQFLSDYSGGNSEFVLGVKHHQLADELWHYGDYFNQKTEAIKNVLKIHNMVDRPFRPFFMTHVMLELLLDRTIVRQEQEVAISLYESLEKIESKFLDELFNDRVLSSRFRGFFENFTENRYTLSYAYNEKFIYALNRLFERVKHPAIELQETDSFVLQLDEIISKDYKIPLQEISNERISKV
ncbi:MAG: hypothetical protein JXQ87_05520 [Bacteroidia bacterium]